MLKAKVLVILAILLVLVANSVSAYNIKDFGVILKKDKNTVTCFKQESLNAMSGQKIIKNGVLSIKYQRQMIFNYGNEKIVINDFSVIDYTKKKKQVYKLSGFNRILYQLFIGKKDIGDLFKVDKKDGSFILTPKYQSNIDSVYLTMKNNKLYRLKIVDIYANKTIYTFDDSDRCSPQKRN